MYPGKYKFRKELPATKDTDERHRHLYTDLLKSCNDRRTTKILQSHILQIKERVYCSMLSPGTQFSFECDGAKGNLSAN